MNAYMVVSTLLLGLLHLFPDGAMEGYGDNWRSETFDRNLWHGERKCVVLSCMSLDFTLGERQSNGGMHIV